MPGAGKIKVLDEKKRQKRKKKRKKKKKESPPYALECREEATAPRPNAQTPVMPGITSKHQADRVTVTSCFPCCSGTAGYRTTQDPPNARHYAGPPHTRQVRLMPADFQLTRDQPLISTGTTALVTRSTKRLKLWYSPKTQACPGRAMFKSWIFVRVKLKARAASRSAARTLC